MNALSINNVFMIYLAERRYFFHMSDEETVIRECEWFIGSPTWEAWKVGFKFKFM